MTARNIIDRVYNLITQRAVYHVLFWVVLYASLVLIGRDKQHSIGTTMLNELFDLIFYMVLVYFNLLYLIPNFLSKRIFLYLLLALLSCLVLAPIKTFVFYLRFAGLPDYRNQLVANQSFVLLGNIFVLSLSTVLNIITGWWRYQQEKTQLVTENMQSELRFLKSQINPHFLFNTLNNLYSLTLKKSDKAPEIVLKLSEIMRYMLYECNEKSVLLSRELQYMQNYLDLEKLRQPKSVEITTLVEGNISDQEIAPLMFIPFLENSFKHGVNNQITAGYVHVRIRVQDNDLEFFIENSKPAHAPRSEHPRSGGIGLNNVRQRLELLYPDAYDLTIENDPNRYAVTLLIKLK